MAVMADIEDVRERLRKAGIDDVVGLEEVTGGLAASSYLAQRRDGSSVFVKAMPGAPLPGAFTTEAEGLRALSELGGARTPHVLHADDDVLVLEPLRPRPGDSDFWSRLAEVMARLHSSTTHDRFGWHHDGWLGRRRQVNSWHDDGFEFFAQHRLLRWLDEPTVLAALDDGYREALERLCSRLPELLPTKPACLTHGDFWMQNILATADGDPVLIDPAVSYTWAEVDLAHVWTTAPPPEAQGFFDRYAELTSLDDGWRDRMPIIQLRQHLAVLAQFDDQWGTGDAARATLEPFRRQRRGGQR